MTEPGSGSGPSEHSRTLLGLHAISSSVWGAGTLGEQQNSFDCTQHLFHFFFFFFDNDRVHVDSSSDFMSSLHTS